MTPDAEKGREMVANFMAVVTVGPIKAHLVAFLGEVETLEKEKAADAWHTGWQVAVRERDEARREADALKAKIAALIEAAREFRDLRISSRPACSVVARIDAALAAAGVVL